MAEPPESWPLRRQKAIEGGDGKVGRDGKSVRPELEAAVVYLGMGCRGHFLQDCPTQEREK